MSEVELSYNHLERGFAESSRREREGQRDGQVSAECESTIV